MQQSFTTLILSLVLATLTANACPTDPKKLCSGDQVYIRSSDGYYVVGGLPVDRHGKDITVWWSVDHRHYPINMADVAVPEGCNADLSLCVGDSIELRTRYAKRPMTIYGIFRDNTAYAIYRDSFEVVRFAIAKDQVYVTTAVQRRTPCYFWHHR